MAITSAICNSFKQELLEGIHDFDGDTFKIALFTSSASLGADTTEYGTTNEVSGTGYTAGGQNLTVTPPALIGSVAVVDLADALWGSSDITAAGALIYNASKVNRAVAVLSFGGNRSSSAGNFRITMPTPDALNAIIRVS